MPQSTQLEISPLLKTLSIHFEIDLSSILFCLLGRWCFDVATKTANFGRFYLGIYARHASVSGAIQMDYPNPENRRKQWGSDWSAEREKHPITKNHQFSRYTVEQNMVITERNSKWRTSRTRIQNCAPLPVVDEYYVPRFEVSTQG